MGPSGSPEQTHKNKIKKLARLPPPKSDIRVTGQRIKLSKYRGLAHGAS
jgi:hypothetical protein